MKYFTYEMGGVKGLAVETGSDFRGLLSTDALYPGDLLTLVHAGPEALDAAGKVLGKGEQLDFDQVNVLPPISHPGKIICVGLNYREHSSETGFETPVFPTLFGRFNSSLIGHRAPIELPSCSEQLDYEGELVAVIGAPVRDVDVDKAIKYVAGYSIFNDASIRDYQFKSPQWTAGKNFDATGAFGPFFVPARDLPAGGRGLRLTTKLSGAVVQSACTDDMVFSVAELVSICSHFMTLEPGDVLVTGTPAGVGLGRKPQLWMKSGDTCEVEIDGIGVLSNPIRQRTHSEHNQLAPVNPGRFWI
jgi:2-keto-4-pentenoate hydratase/2-oxohepta-3-ene-1,7-dioic acid hydratase in catechol pathway